MAASARLMIIGQAPGTKVHETGIPWNDRSGDQLRQWLGLDRDVFYDETRIAIMPMGFCYPGRDARGGDSPPRPECARSEEHTSELQSLMRISYAVFCLKKKNRQSTHTTSTSDCYINNTAH